MERNNSIKIRIFIIGFLMAPVAYATEGQGLDTRAVPCAVVSDTRGEVQLLDETRKRIAEVLTEKEIACGSWLTVGKGAFVHLKHRDGFEFRVGPDSFVEVLDPEVGVASEAEKGKTELDHLVLYRGSVYGHTEGGSEEFRVLTANARTRLRRGEFVTLYNKEGQATQLIVTQGQASLENRFRPEAKQKIKAGEASSVDYELNRVVPTLAEAISPQGLREKLEAFKFEKPMVDRAVKVAKGKHERKVLASIDDLNHSAKKGAEGSTPANHSQYEKARLDHKAKQQKQAVFSHLENRLLGGSGGRGPASVETQSPNDKNEKAFNAEKKRLLQELSEIREE